MGILNFIKKVVEPIGNAFNSTEIFYRGLVLKPEDAAKIETNGMWIPNYMGPNKEWYNKTCEDMVEEGYPGHKIKVDIERYGFRQVPFLLGRMTAGAYVGMFLTPVKKVAGQYALNLMGRSYDVTPEHRGYIFVIGVEKSEVVFQRKNVIQPVDMKYNVCRCSTSEVYWLDTFIPANRIVKVIDLGPVIGPTLEEKKAILENLDNNRDD